MAASPADAVFPELIRGPRCFNEPWSSGSVIADCFLLLLVEIDDILGDDVEGVKCMADELATACGRSDDGRCIVGDDCDMGIEDNDGGIMDED